MIVMLDYTLNVHLHSYFPTIIMKRSSPPFWHIIWDEHRSSLDTYSFAKYFTPCIDLLTAIAISCICLPQKYAQFRFLFIYKTTPSNLWVCVIT